MNSEPLAKILEAEKQAKNIISQAEETGKKLFSDMTERKKELLKQEEAKCKKQTEAYLHNLQSKKDEEIKALSARSDEVKNQTIASLRKHKKAMTDIALNHITGKENA